VVSPIIAMKATSSEYFPLNSTPLCFSCKPQHSSEDIVSIFGNLEMQYGLYQELYHTFSIRGDFLVSQTTIATANWILCSAIVIKKRNKFYAQRSPIRLNLRSLTFRRWVNSHITHTLHTYKYSLLLTQTNTYSFIFCMCVELTPNWWYMKAKEEMQCASN
jgi:hypothetical protein